MISCLVFEEAFGLHTGQRKLTDQRGASMTAVLFILAGYAIVPVLVVSMKSNALHEGGHSRFPAVDIITS
jgi:hypothetical protein